MSMIPLGASSCARKAISWSTEQWGIFVKTWFYLCVRFCHGEYMKVHKTAIITLHVALCYKGTKEFRTFGNLRNFYCLQDHTTSNNNGERQGQGQRTS